MNEPNGFSPGLLSVLLLFTRRASMHVHAICADGEAKFWLIPEVALAKNYRLSKRQLIEAERIIKEHYEEIAGAWAKHFNC